MAPVYLLYLDICLWRRRRRYSSIFINDLDHIFVHGCAFDGKLRLPNLLISNSTEIFCVMKIWKYLTTYKKLTMTIWRNQYLLYRQLVTWKHELFSIFMQVSIKSEMIVKSLFCLVYLKTNVLNFCFLLFQITS